MPESTPPSKIRFHYEKGRLFRVLHVDGVLGGITPTRNIFVSLYSQRAPLPKVVDQTFAPDGTLTDEVVVEGKTGVFREMEIGLVVTAAVAKEIARFLNEQAKLLEESKQTNSHNTLAQGKRR
jgi:hypothetical protein